MPTRGASVPVGRAILSIAQQSVDMWELIVVGDDPAVQSAVREFRDSRIRYSAMRDSACAGRAAQRNHGNALARAPIVAVVEPEQVSSSARAAVTLGAFEDPTCDVFYPAAGIEAFAYPTQDNRSDHLARPIDPALIPAIRFDHHGAAAFRRSIALLHPYNTFFAPGEDYDLLTRLAAAGLRFHLTSEPVVDTGFDTTPALIDIQMQRAHAVVRQARGWDAFDPATSAALEEDPPALPVVELHPSVGSRETPVFDNAPVIAGDLDLRLAVIERKLDILVSRRPSRGSLADRMRHLLRRVLAPRMFVYEQYKPKPLRFPPSRTIGEPLDGWPSIAIVTPSYQQGGFIGQTIASILDQDYPKLDYFVADGGSTDQTTTELRSHEGSLRWHSQADRGQAHAINLGFEQVQGEIMGWVNSDDMLAPGALRIVGAFFAANPDVDLVYGNRIFIDAWSKDIGRCILPPFEGEVLKWTDYVPQETMFWRRRMWDKTGPLDEAYRFALDWDFLLRALRSGARMRHLPVYMGCFRVHASQKNASISDVGAAEMAILRERELGYLPNGLEIRSAIWRYMARHVVYDRIQQIRRLFAWQ